MPRPWLLPWPLHLLVKGRSQGLGTRLGEGRGGVKYCSDPEVDYNCLLANTADYINLVISFIGIIKLRRLA